MNIVGNTIINNLKIPTNPVDNYVLTSDSNGNATWKITDQSKENKIKVINAVRDPFFAISIFSGFENLSVMIISIGEIPIGFIRVNKVVRQKIKKFTSCCIISYILHSLW